MLGEQAWRVWSCDAHLLVTDVARTADAAAVANRLIAEIGEACDRFRPGSELSRIRPGRPNRISPLLEELVATALTGAQQTGGLCDPTVGSAMAAIGYDRDIRMVLDDDRPIRVIVRPRPVWRAVTCAGGELTVPIGVQLDLGATAKAFAVDRIAAEIASEFACGVLMNLGGDIATAGPAPENGWQVRVQDLPCDPAAHVTLAAGFALATSSTQRRTWRRAGQQMHHIVDPRTGTPADRVWRTVSVVAPTAVLANGESTAAIVAGSDARGRLAESGLAARLVADDGTVHLIGGWPAELTEVA